MPAFTATDSGGAFLYNKKADAPGAGSKKQCGMRARHYCKFFETASVKEKKGERPVGIFKTNRLSFEGLLLSCELYRMVR